MPRLIVTYPIATAVEIYFEAPNRWVAGTVVAHQHPAVWVCTADGQRWFVTNGRKIRHPKNE